MLMTPDMAAALKARRPPITLAEVGHPSGTGYYWSGVGPLAHDGRTWVGMGKLGAVSPIVWTTDIQIQDVTFTLVGLSPADAALINENIRGYLGLIWLGCLDEAMNVVADPFRIARVRFDTMTFPAADDGSVTIQIVGHPAFQNLTRAAERTWSPESQKRDYPDDTGMDCIPKLQNQEIQWTRT